MEHKVSKHPEVHGVPRFEGLQKIDAPNQLHPAHIPEDQAENISGVGWARNFLQEASKAWNGINDMRVNRDPEHTEDAHVLRINEQVQKQAQRLEQSLDKAREHLNMSRTKYRQEIADAAKLDDSRHGAEIRSVIRAMKPEERQTAILQAMQEDDRETLAAALSGPAIAAGLTREQQKNLRDKFEQRVAPKAFEALAAVNRAEDRAFDAFEQFRANSGKLAAEDRAKHIREKQAQAKKAAGAFAA